jgi:transposase-like protein
VDKTQDSKHRHFSPHEKVAVVKRHLLKRVPISAICEELKIAPNMFYRWPQELVQKRSSVIRDGSQKQGYRGNQGSQDRRSQDRKTSPALKGWATIGSRYATAGMR